MRKEFVIADDDDRSNTDEEPRKNTATVTSPIPATRSKTENTTPYAYALFVMIFEKLIRRISIEMVN